MRSSFQNVSFQRRARLRTGLPASSSRSGRMFQDTTFSGSFIHTAPQYPSVGTFLILRSKPIFLRLACIEAGTTSSMPDDHRRDEDLRGGVAGFVEVELGPVRIELPLWQLGAMVRAVGRTDRVVVAHRAVPLEDGSHDAFAVLDELHAFHEVVALSRWSILETADSAVETGRESS